jgi:hypothetical protein
VVLNVIQSCYYRKVKGINLHIRIQSVTNSLAVSFENLVRLITCSMISESLPNGTIRNKTGKSRDGFRRTLNLMYVRTEGYLRAGHTEVMA